MVRFLLRSSIRRTLGTHPSRDLPGSGEGTEPPLDALCVEPASLACERFFCCAQPLARRHVVARPTCELAARLVERRRPAPALPQPGGLLRTGKKRGRLVEQTRTRRGGRSGD